MHHRLNTTNPYSWLTLPEAGYECVEVILGSMIIHYLVPELSNFKSIQSV